MDSIVEALVRAARRYPGNVAYKDSVGSITYRQLDELASRLARFLSTALHSRGERVAILLEKNLEMVVSIFGTLKAGSTFVPLNIAAPASQIQYYLADTGAKTVICDRFALPRLPAKQFLPDLASILVFDEQPGDPTVLPEGYDLVFRATFMSATAGPLLRVEGIDGETPLYIMYTSGSTGHPKGVPMKNSNVLPLLRYIDQQMDYDEKSTCLSMSPPFFDPFIVELFSCLLSGGKSVLVDKVVSIRKLLRTIQDEKVTAIGFGPLLLKQMVDNIELLEHYDLSTLRHVFFGQSHCPVAQIAELMKRLPATAFFHGYGTTETAISNTYHRVTAQPSREAFPIGAPVDGTRLHFIDQDGRIVQQGAVCELGISGACVMDGYWHNEAATRAALKRFVIDGKSTMVYVTGDLFKVDNRGDAYFLGRKDEQVKLRGYRIELGQVEAVVSAFGGVKECAAVVESTVEGRRLVCYVVLRGGARLEELKGHCRNRVESCMVPTRWVIVEKLPRNDNGKVDKHALLADLEAPGPALGVTAGS